jgi:hypothetical protein
MLSSLFSIKRAWLFAIAFAFAAPAVYAQTDPTNQINWPLTTITGSDTPIQACTAGNYGQPFQRTDVTPNKFGTCGADGWQYRGSGSGSGGVGAHVYSSCPAATGSSSELMVMKVSSTCAMPLPAIVAGYNVAVQTSTSSTVSIAPPGGVTLYVAGVSASTLTIPNGQTVFVTTDGTSYYAVARHRLLLDPASRSRPGPPETYTQPFQPRRGIVSRNLECHGGLQHRAHGCGSFR